VVNISRLRHQHFKGGAAGINGAAARGIAVAVLSCVVLFKLSPSGAATAVEHKCRISPYRI
jgi:hypothetical protein